MPFGSDPFRECETIEEIWLRDLKAPMPFGSDPFREKNLAVKAAWRLAKAPMPFGSDPFRERIQNPLCLKKGKE